MQIPQPHYTQLCVDGTPLLTDKEKEVSCLVAQGMTSKEIASELGKSHSSVENQIHTILHKLKQQGIHRRVDLTRWVLTVGL